MVRSCLFSLQFSVVLQLATVLQLSVFSGCPPPVDVDLQLSCALWVHKLDMYVVLMFSVHFQLDDILRHYVVFQPSVNLQLSDLE
jgi:hypothetical protein